MSHSRLGSKPMIDMDRSELMKSIDSEFNDKLLNPLTLEDINPNDYSGNAFSH